MYGPERDIGGADVSYSQANRWLLDIRAGKLPIANASRGYGSDLSPHLNVPEPDVDWLSVSAKNKEWVRIPQGPNWIRPNTDRHNLFRNPRLKTLADWFPAREKGESTLQLPTGYGDR